MGKNKIKIAIVVSEFYPELSESLQNDCIYELVSNRVERKSISIYKVSGVFEIPGAISQIAKNQSVDAVIALGVVIKGETPHFDFISSACANSISALTLENDFPITFGVLTTNTYKQALNRSKEKGSDIATTTILSIDTYKKIKS